MRELIIGLQLAALLPIIVVLMYRSALNLFFKLLLASILLSLFSDSISTLCSFYFENNIPIICLYYLANAILLTLMWQKVPFYDNSAKIFIRILGYSFIGIMVIIILCYSFTEPVSYVMAGLSVVLGLLLSLHYYKQKLLVSTYTPLLKDPYFIVASGLILFCLSTIIILAAQIFYQGKGFLFYIWSLRQIFYLIYNIIISYAFYTLYKIQMNR